jgi:HK97 family phage prohead protease
MAGSKPYGNVADPRNGAARDAKATYSDLYTCGECDATNQYGAYCGDCGQEMKPSQASGGYCTSCGSTLGGSMREAHVCEARGSAKPYGNVTYADPKNGKYPIDTKAHAKAAWSYINQADNAAEYPLNGVTLAEVKGRIKAACKGFGITVSEGNSAPADGEYRTVPFDLASAEINGDGLTFSGYAAVFGATARIAGWDEDFDEQIAPGAFRAIAAGAYPVLMFEHGRHPLIGTMPLGKITSAREDPKGLFIEARLIDNWLISPVRDAVAAEAIDGMSFRFTVNDGGETWVDRSGDVALRTLSSLSVPELGPVVFPAYEPTTASVRSVLDKLPVIGRPPAGARAASDREGGAGQRQPHTLIDRYRGDGEQLALRGIKGARI